MTTYKNALEALKNDNRAVIISNENVILLKVNDGYSLVRNDLEKLQQTRYKTVRSIGDLEDDWMDKNAEINYEDGFKDEDEAIFKFTLMVVASTHRDITL